ncbi:glycosyltransferase family 2 protein [Blastomonas sp. AAP53]|uniref:glycosyltransferase family 2 protein n=1 Tax=Blastomonas sp. AAP53 TaxID=1248760 RepID=UPI00058EB15E|nr:glycosyltransferase family 2 protein [Blastomonas sp. AAP53]
MQRWSALVACYNEQAFLPEMLASLLAQSVPCRIVVVDNGSTDLTLTLAKDLLSGVPGATVLSETRPGQVHALAHGLRHIDTEFVAICDADTLYPANYLASATRLLDRPNRNIVAACAWPRTQASSVLANVLAAGHRLAAQRLMPRQNHVNGGSQTFRTAALLAAGGYDAAIWPYVLKDHELMNRVLHFGDQAMSGDFWCSPSPRRGDRRRVRWTLTERLAYHTSRFRARDAFFHDWLAPRLEMRGQRDTVLRDQPWNAA